MAPNARILHAFRMSFIGLGGFGWGRAVGLALGANKPIKRYAKCMGERLRGLQFHVGPHPGLDE